MTAEELAALMKKRIDLFEPAFRSATKECVRLAVSRSKQLLTEGIYSIPEDLTAQGERRFAKFRTTRRPGQVFTPRKGDRKWVRTGHLRRSEEPEIISAYKGAVVNNAVYAKRRHDAPDVEPAWNINKIRISHWRNDLVEDMREAVLTLRRDAVQRVLKGGKL